jgi:NitT/TauT family transport system substrate-binding protein
MKSFRQAFVFMVTALVVAMCGPNNGNASSQNMVATSDTPGSSATMSPTKVRVIASFIDSIPAMASLKVAYQRGYFKDAGLELTFASAIGGGDTLRPLTTGDADVAIGAPAASILAVQKNSDLKIAAIWLPYNPFYFIGTKPLLQMNGATLGGSVGASTVNLLINGLDEKLNVKFTIQKAGTGSMADNWDAVKAGHLQASWAMEPFLTQKKQSDGAQVVIDPVKVLPDYPADFVVVNEKFATLHAQAMKGFFQAIERVFNEFPDPSKQAALAKDLAGVMVFSEPVIRQYLSSDGADRLSKTYNLKMNANVLKNVSHLMQQAKLIKTAVDWTKYVDQSYLPAGDQLSNLP